MNASTAWDPHLNRTVPIFAYIQNGINSSSYYFNPYDFKSPFPTQGWVGVPANDTVLVSPAALCYFPLSGSYCTLSRILFLVEVIFALMTLALGYAWLSTVAAAAVLNYTTVAALHLIVLYCIPGNSALDLDNVATSLIVVNSIFFAYPLLQWSQTLRKKDYANTRFIVAIWAVLLCGTAILYECTTLHMPQLPPVAEIFVKNFKVQAGTNYGFASTLRPDTINALLLDVADVQSQFKNYTVGSCTALDPNYISTLRQGQSLMPALHYAQFVQSRSYGVLVKAFGAYAVITSAATVAATLHGKYSTQYVRARGYLAIAGSSGIKWRKVVAFALAYTYYMVHFIVGILSLPIAIVVFVIIEIELQTYPCSDNNSYIGQWGAWAGAAAVFLAVAMTESSLVPGTRNFVVWAVSAPLAALFPHRVSRRTRPSVNSNVISNSKEMFVSFGRFFSEEYQSTKYWMLQPGLASWECVELEYRNATAGQTEVPASVKEAGEKEMWNESISYRGLHGTKTWGTSV